jgi:hypothetical protein
MPRVFIVCKQSSNAKKASRFGEVTVLHDLTASPSANRLSLAPSRIFTKFALPMNSFEPNDLLLLDGPNVYSAIAASMAAVITSRLGLLVYDHTIKNYVKRTMHLPVAQCRKDTNGSPPTVWVATDSHDTSKAEKWGKISVLIKAAKEVQAKETRKILNEILTPLKRSGSADFLLLAGEKSINALAAAVLARRHKKLNLLLMHHKLKRYEARTVDISRERIRSVIS